MQQRNQALFCAIARQDYGVAQKLLQANANPNALYEVEKGKYISAFNLFITKCALLGVKKGQNNSQYKACSKILKDMTKAGTMECKCTNEHKCPLYTAIQIFKITDQKQIVEGKCELIRFLIINGATLKYENKQNKKAEKSIGKWQLRWFDIEGIRAYLVTKNFNYLQTKV